MESRSCDLSRNVLCPGMENNIQNNESGSVVDQKGLSTFKPMNLKDSTFTLKAVVYKKSSRDNGTVLNFCPWCGADYGFVKQ